MCGIICFNSIKDYSTDELNNLLTSLAHRGPDHSNISTFKLIKSSKIYFIVTQLMIVGNEPFPIEFTFQSSSDHETRSLLIGNIEIYNYKDIYRNFFENDFSWNGYYSDAHIILPLFQSLYQKNYSLQVTFSDLLQIIEGDYAFVLFIENNYLLIARDQVGIRPLYYVFESTSNFAFSSEVQTLIDMGYNYTQIKTVEPGSYSILNLNIETKFISWSYLDDSLLKITNSRNLYDSNYSFNLDTVLEYTYRMIMNSVEIRIPHNKFALFLSGGIDSSVLLAILKHLNKNSNVKVISVGFEDSSDLLSSKSLCESLNIELDEVIIKKNDIEEALPVVVNLLRSRSNEINVIDVSIALPFFFASKRAKELGCKVAFSGQGADELFIGYKKYYELDLVTNREKMIGLVNNDLINIASQNLERDDLISMYFSVEIRFPYLEIKLIKHIMSLDINTLYSGNEANRKELLRKVAAKFNLPYNILIRPKKAAQYGTSIMKNLHSLAKPHNSIKEYLNSLK